LLRRFARNDDQWEKLAYNSRQAPERGRQAMNDTDADNKARNREIAQNEATRQTGGDIRASTWAISVAVIIGLAAVGWVLIHNN
jgi:hypothetical protein